MPNSPVWMAVIAMMMVKRAPSGGDTHVGTLRKTYGEDFAEGYRSDMRLATLLKREGVKSLNDLLEKK